MSNVRNHTTRMKSSLLKLGESLILCLLVMHSPSWAADNNDKKGQDQCEKLFVHKNEPGPIQVISSGRDEDVLPTLEEAAYEITHVAHRLGLATPPHQFNFVPSGQLNVLATKGGHAAPHWTDGSEIVGALKQSMGILEFVTPGCPTCRSYYSDTTSLEHQISVIMHVMGHNDMAETSLYEKVRPSDGPAASYELAQFMSKMYDEYDHDEVSLFYQYLNSMKWMQDFARGTYDSPEKLASKSDQIPERIVHTGSDVDALLGRETPANSYRKAKKSWHSTPSVLQAFVNNLPAHSAPWKKEMIRLYEEANKVFPAIVQTKTMNEGWATLMQYIIARHVKWNTSKDLVEYAQLMSGVAVPSLTNPYWVGVTGWQNLYDQFMEKPEIKEIESEFEKDRQFIGWAKKTYANLSDVEWAKLALDARWLEKWNLFLYRQTQREEMNPAIPPEKQEYIALSRDPQRLQRFIIRNYLDKSRMIPRVFVHNFDANASDKVVLEYEPVENIPLERTTAVKTMFVLAQIMKKPVELKTIGSELWLPQDAGSAAAGNSAYGRTEQPQAPGSFSMEMIARPNGQVEVYKVTEEGRESLDFMAQPLEDIVTAYREDMISSFNPDFTLHERKKWARFLEQAGDQNVMGTENYVNYAPTAADALYEYLELIEYRTAHALKQAVSGQRPVDLGPRGAKLRVLPEIPQFGFDQQVMAMLKTTKPVAPVDTPAGDSQSLPWDVDDNGVAIAPGPYMPGDVFPGPQKDQGEGEGEGEGEEGEGEEGDPSDEPGDPGDDPSQGTGSGSGDPSEIEVPLELYGELLSEYLELPNIRRTMGRTKELSRVRRGSVKKPNGYVLWEKVAEEAMNKARAVRKAKGLPYGPEVDGRILIKEGMKMIEPPDIRVAGSMDLPRPDFDAVMVVAIDLTGSMSGDPIKIAKNLVYNMKAVLKAKYKNVVVRFVGFDSQAKEIPESKIWKAFFGGGTSYAPALTKTKEILDEYPNSKWNKYSLVIGDGQGYDVPEFMNELEELHEDLQYFGLAVTGNPDWANKDLLQALADYRSEWPWVGLASASSQQEIGKALQELFPKGGKPGEE